jgi:hypothetical protein
LSFRYFDPILRIVQTQTSDDRREFFELKNKFDIEKLFEKNLWAKITARINGLGGDGKLTFKH